MWAGARVSSFNPLTSGFSLFYPTEAALSNVTGEFHVAKLQGHFSLYLIRPLLYIDHFLILEILFS